MYYSTIVPLKSQIEEKFMKLKYTIILLSLTTPLAAETDCLQNKNETLYEIISCLNKKEIDNARAITKKAADIKGLTDKLTILAKKQRKEIVILKKQVLKNQNKSSKLEQQLVDLNQALEQLKRKVVYFEQPF